MPIASGIYYTIYEGGEPGSPVAVLIHGAGSSRVVWPRELRRLRGYRVLTLDLQGHGKSHRQTVGHSLSTYAIQIVDFLLSLDISRAYFVGHSMGGAIALSIAHQYSTLVVGLVLISSGAHLYVDQDWLTALGNPDTQSSAFEQFRELAFSTKTSPEIIKKTMDELDITRASVIYADWLACSEFDLRDHVHEIKAKTRLVWGHDDRITPLSNAYFLLQQLPDASLEILPDAGHLVVLERPKQTAESVQSFLSTLK